MSKAPISLAKSSGHLRAMRRATQIRASTARPTGWRSATRLRGGCELRAAQRWLLVTGLAACTAQTLVFSGVKQIQNFNDNLAFKVRHVAEAFSERSYFEASNANQLLANGMQTALTEDASTGAFDMTFSVLVWQFYTLGRRDRALQHKSRSGVIAYDECRQLPQPSWTVSSQPCGEGGSVYTTPRSAQYTRTMKSVMIFYHPTSSPARDLLPVKAYADLEIHYRQVLEICLLEVWANPLSLPVYAECIVRTYGDYPPFTHLRGVAVLPFSPDARLLPGCMPHGFSSPMGHVQLDCVELKREAYGVEERLFPNNPFKDICIVAGEPWAQG